MRARLASIIVLKIFNTFSQHQARGSSLKSIQLFDGDKRVIKAFPVLQNESLMLWTLFIKLIIISFKHSVAQKLHTKLLKPIIWLVTSLFKSCNSIIDSLYTCLSYCHIYATNWLRLIDLATNWSATNWTRRIDCDELNGDELTGHLSIFR